MSDAGPQKLCPKGHPVRTAFGKSRCSSRRCGQEAEAAIGATEIDLDAQASADPKDLAFQGRASLARLPRGLKGEEATKWAQDKLVELLPEAVASVAHDLRYGNDKTRAEAADKVLRANGLDKREAAPGGGGLIVLNLSPQSEAIPWLQRMAPKESK